MITMSRLTRLGAIALCSVSCGGTAAECLALPCPLPLAVTITVTSSASTGAISGAFVSVAGGGFSSALPCNGSPARCSVSGYAGTYQLDIGAPGYQTTHRAVVVSGNSPACGCASAETQHLDVALVPTP